jgi:hypothetical protein
MIRTAPAAEKNVSLSSKKKYDATMVTRGSKYTYTLVFITPSLSIAVFHVEKQTAEATSPRYRRFPKTTGCAKPSSGKSNGLTNMKYGIIVSNP